MPSNVHDNAPSISEFRGILLGTLDQYDPDRPDALWNLSDGRTVVPCLIPSPDLLHELISRPLTTYWMQLVDWVPAQEQAPVPPPILTSARVDATNDALFQLPLDVCPVEGVYSETLDLIDLLTTPPLREMVTRVFLDREVCARYWTMPASARHHHAWPGGLATHSLEVAMDLANQCVLTGTERELAVAGGLLHDIGKLWAYTPDMFPNTANRAMGHELIGLSRLERELKILEGQWPDGAYALRVLLSGCGRMRPNGSMPSALVARIKAADQRSCEQNRSFRPGASQSWIPQDWSNDNASTPESP